MVDPLKIGHQQPHRQCLLSGGKAVALSGSPGCLKDLVEAVALSRPRPLAPAENSTNWSLTMQL